MRGTPHTGQHLQGWAAEGQRPRGRGAAADAHGRGVRPFMGVHCAHSVCVLHCVCVCVCALHSVCVRVRACTVRYVGVAPHRWWRPQRERRRVAHPPLSLSLAHARQHQPRRAPHMHTTSTPPPKKTARTSRHRRMATSRRAPWVWACVFRRRCVWGPSRSRQWRHRCERARAPRAFGC
jgi:hypothetical protein